MMKTRINTRVICLGMGVVALLLWPAALLLAQDEALSPAATYTLTRWTVDGGGTTGTSNGAYMLSGTAGQPDTGTLEAGDYVLGGGFWAGGEFAGTGHRIYLPLAVRN